MPTLYEYIQMFKQEPAPRVDNVNSAGFICANRVQFGVAGLLFGLQFIRLASDTGNHFGWLRQIGPGKNSSPIIFPYPANSAYDNTWNRGYFRSPVAVNVGDIYQLNLWYGNFDYCSFGPVLPNGGNYYGGGTDFYVQHSYKDQPLSLQYASTLSDPTLYTVDVIFATNPGH